MKLAGVLEVWLELGVLEVWGWVGLKILEFLMWVWVASFAATCWGSSKKERVIRSIPI